MFYNRKFAIYTLGCKLNFSEGSAISRNLVSNGFQHVDFSEIADYYIINTCSVTENADKKCKALVRQILKKAEQAKVIVIGCYAQLKPEEIASIPGVTMVLGANEKFNIASHLLQIDEQTSKIITSDIKDVNFYAPSFSFGERTRSFLKIQDGCDYFCTFCTIPLARGRSRSASIQKTVEIAQEIAQTGVKEVVITGVNIGDFGKTEDGKKRTSENLFQLIQELDRIEQIDRWRISSIEPNLLNEEIIEFVASSNSFMPHFHIPLQSGSDTILKAMHRKYDTTLYKNRIAKIKTSMPHACIGVDVIVGFPGETEEEFLKTYHFLNELDISYLHIFTYSERDNTNAIKSKEIIPIEERRRRNEMLRILSEKKRNAFYEQHLNSIRTVLFESENDEGYMHGFTDNYIKVKTKYDATLCNEIKEVVIEKLLLGGFAGITFENEEIKA
ncbi:MAG: tRNA (N(6)-L-threonylcarbamoyladenosine(37)-C(2))-methylthiotransferase MtaB [Bacteroidota bacterium]